MFSTGKLNRIVERRSPCLTPVDLERLWYVNITLYFAFSMFDGHLYKMDQFHWDLQTFHGFKKFSPAGSFTGLLEIDEQNVKMHVMSKGIILDLF